MPLGWLSKIRNFLPQEIPGPIAVLYEKVATRVLRQLYCQVASEISSTLVNGRVLDVGTGPGHLLVEISRQNPHLELVGLDLSRTMLNIAEDVIGQATRPHSDTHGPKTFSGSVNTNAGYQPIRLVRADVRNIPFPDGSFDMVISTLSMHHWRSPAEGLRECWRVTAPGGRCWIYDLRSDVPASVHAKLLAGEGLRHSLLSWIFKFHGVDPKQYQACTVAFWLGGGAAVQAEAHAAYLKINIEKPLCKSPDEAICSRRISSVISAVPPVYKT